MAIWLVVGLKIIYFVRFEVGPIKWIIYVRPTHLFYFLLFIIHHYWPVRICATFT